jgi:hypothetical protein
MKFITSVKSIMIQAPDRLNFYKLNFFREKEGIDDGAKQKSLTSLNMDKLWIKLLQYHVYDNELRSVFNIRFYGNFSTFFQ